VEVTHDKIKTNKVPIRKEVKMQVIWWNGVIKTEKKYCWILEIK